MDYKIGNTLRTVHTRNTVVLYMSTVCTVSAGRVPGHYPSDGWPEGMGRVWGGDGYGGWHLELEMEVYSSIVSDLRSGGEKIKVGNYDYLLFVIAELLTTCITEN